MNDDERLFEIVPPKYCPIIDGYCADHCAWEHDGECAVSTIAGSLAKLEPEQLHDIASAIDRLANEA